MADEVTSIDDFVKKYGTDSATLLIREFVTRTTFSGGETRIQEIKECVMNVAADLQVALRNYALVKDRS